MKGLLILLGFFLLSYGFGQTDSTANEGEIVSGEVIIEKNKKIVLPKANKRYQKGRLRKFDERPISIELNSFQPDLQWPPYKSDVEVQEINSEFPIEDHLNYVKLGYGNLGSPLLELGIFERTGSWELKHKFFYERFANGPINGANSAASELRADFSGSYQTEQLNITPFIDIDHRTYRFYGNTDRANPGFSQEDLPKVRWTQFEMGAMLQGRARSVHYSMTPQFGFTGQNPESGGKLNSESQFGIDGSLNLKIDERFATGFNVQGHTSSFEGSLSYNRSLFTVRPWLEYRKEDFRLHAGFNVSSGKSSGTSQAGFYPDVRGEWNIENDWQLYAYLKGGIDWVDLNSQLSENEFLDDSLLLLNIENELSLGGGLKGSLFSNLFLDVNLTYAELTNLPFFIPSANDSSRYTIAYDEGSVQRLRLFSKLTYSPTNSTIIGASLRADSYSVSTLDRPWHLPAFELAGFASQNIKQKVILSARITSIGGIRAPSAIDFGIENLGTIVDLGLDAKFLLTERASAFVSTQNIFNNQYERYLGYPVRGITFKIGGQYRF